MGRADNKLIMLLLLAVMLISGMESLSANDAVPVVIYLECNDNIDQDVDLSFDLIGLIAGNDTTYVTPSITNINSQAISGRQIVLANTELQPGDYEKIIFKLKSVSTTVQFARVQPEVKADGYGYLLSKTIAKFKSNAIFLKWQPSFHEIESSEYQFNLAVINRSIPPIGSQIIVSNSGSESITIIDRTSYKVVESIHLGQKPTEMLYFPDLRYLYVLITDDNVICNLDITNMNIIRRVPLNFNSLPSKMILSQDKRKLFVLNRGSNSILVLDPITLQEELQFLVEYDPIDIDYHQELNRLYISNSFNKYFTTIDLNNSSQGQLNFNEIPGEFELETESKTIFAAALNESSLLGYDLLTGAQKFRIKVCGKVNNLIYNRFKRTLYASIPRCRTILFVNPFEEMIINSIDLKAEPGRIATDDQLNNLYVTLPEMNEIEIYNINSRQLISKIPVGKNPFTVIVPD